MTIVYSTSEVLPRDRVSYWREVVNKDLPRHEFHSHVGPAFNGSVQASTLGGLSVAVVACDPCEAKRTQRDLVHGNTDTVILSLQLSGRTLAHQDDREAIIEPGSFTLYDMTRACGGLHLTKVKAAVFSLPRKGVEARLGNIGALTAHEMPMRKPIASLAAGFLSMLAERAGTLDAAAGPKLCEQALDLVALAFSHELGLDGVTLSSPRGAALMRLKSAIEARLCDPTLRPAAAAAAAGISVRYANNLLSEEGTSVERYILHRRLERCRQALEDTAQCHRMISEVAFSWGFSDLSHFSRRFRAAYGMTPRDWRRRAQLAAVTAADPEAEIATGV